MDEAFCVRCSAEGTLPCYKARPDQTLRLTKFIANILSPFEAVPHSMRIQRDGEAHYRSGRFYF